MRSATARKILGRVDDEAAIRAIPRRMIDAWNAGSAARFAAPFADDADFVAFEGTHLKGRDEIEAFHQRVFATTVKGTRLEGEARFVTFLGSEVAAMHSVARVTLPGQSRTTPSRDSMQLFVVEKRAGEWRVAVAQNSRILTLDRQLFMDQLDALTEERRRQVESLVASIE